jgi:ATP-dependent Clp endopeptidase proteolytic subunit ClpP
MKYKFNQNPYLYMDDPIESLALPREVSLYGELDSESGSIFRQTLRIAEVEAKQIGQPIIPIKINSPGGEVYELMACLDAMKSCELPIATIVEGRAMSAASILAATGAVGLRFCSPLSTYMIHQVNGGIEGSMSDVESYAEEMQRINKEIWSIVSVHCRHRKDYFYNQIKKNGNSDLYLTSEMAIKHKLVDHDKIPTMSVTIHSEFDLTL